MKPKEKGRFSAVVQLSSGDFEPGSALTNRFEQGGFGSSHPDLPAAGTEPIEQSRAAGGIEMRGDLVEEQDRAAA
jgi:hypothetical protein